MRINRVDDAWDINKINFANQPSVPSTVYADFTITQIGKVKLDITPLGKYWMATKNHGMRIDAKKTNEPMVDFAAPTITIDYCN